MSAKKSAEVVIGGKLYTLSGYEEEDYLHKVAAYINNKIADYNEMDGFKRLPPDMKSTLIQLNIADDYFKAREQVEKYEADLERKEADIYDLKHNLISEQARYEKVKETVDDLEREKRELLHTKEKLEASLQDALLGSLDTPEG